MIFDRTLVEEARVTEKSGTMLSTITSIAASMVHATLTYSPSRGILHLRLACFARAPCESNISLLALLSQGHQAY